MAERLHPDLRVETFDLLNRPNFQRPATTFNTPQFGIITGTKRPRNVQLAFKNPVLTDLVSGGCPQSRYLM